MNTIEKLIDANLLTSYHPLFISENDVRNYRLNQANKYVNQFLEGSLSEKDFQFNIIEVLKRPRDLVQNSILNERLDLSTNIVNKHNEHRKRIIQELARISDGIEQKVKEQTQKGNTKGNNDKKNE